MTDDGFETTCPVRIECSIDGGSVPDLISEISAFRTESVEVVVPYVHGIAVGALVALGILDLRPITPAFGTQSVEVVVPGVYGETVLALVLLGILGLESIASAFGTTSVEVVVPHIQDVTIGALVCCHRMFPGGFRI